MISNAMVKHINEKLNGLTRGKNTNFGKNEAASEAPEEGILVVLTKNQTIQELTKNEILASSTVLGSNNEIFEAANNTISVISIPYSETISVDTGEANGFAIVQVTSANLTSKGIIGSDASVKPYNKFIINKDELDGCSVLFSGSINTAQSIGVDNSFSLSNIKITFN